jgi:hypothetical protein
MAKHPERNAMQAVAMHKLRVRTKDQVLTHYGNGKLACVKCGFGDVKALSIDHIHGKNNMEGRPRHYSSASFCRWLISEGYPAGYQTLCMNCQWIKRFEQGEGNRKDALFATDPGNRPVESCPKLII